MSDKKYLDVDDGVYYQPQTDKIYVLKYTGKDVFNTATNTLQGKFYNVETVDMEMKNTTINICELIRLGDL